MRPQTPFCAAVLAAAALLFLSSCSFTSSTPPTSTAVVTPRRVSHTYDLRYIIPQHPANTPIDPDEELRSLVDNFWSTLDHDAWRVHGGTRGDLRLVGDHLVVTTSPENLLALDTALGEFAFRRGLSVDIEARALLVPAALVDKARIGWAHRIPMTLNGTPEYVDASILDYAALTSLFQAIQAENHVLSFTAPRFATPNGYRVNFKLDLSHPDEPHPATAATAPTLLIPSSNYLAVSIAPIVSGDRRSITCEFSGLQISRVSPPLPAAATRPASVNDATDAMVSMPDGGTILIGKALKPDPSQSLASTYLLFLIRANLPRGSEGYNPTFHAMGGIIDQINFFEPATVNDLLWALHDPSATPPVDHSRPTGLPPPSAPAR